jgi:hypothetical protein
MIIIIFHTLDGQQAKTSLFFLPHFKHLTRLSFHNVYGNDLRTFDIQQIRPNLVKFKFTTSIPIPDHRVNIVLQDIHQQMKIYNKNMDEVLYYNTILKELELELEFPVLTATYIKYITTYLPTHMNKVHVSFCNYNLYNWIEEVGLEFVMQLGFIMHALATIPSNSSKELQVPKQK